MLVITTVIRLQFTVEFYKFKQTFAKDAERVPMPSMLHLKLAHFHMPPQQAGCWKLIFKNSNWQCYSYGLNCLM